MITIEQIDNRIKALEQCVTERQQAYFEAIGALKEVIGIRKYIAEQEAKKENELDAEAQAESASNEDIKVPQPTEAAGSIPLAGSTDNALGGKE